MRKVISLRIEHWVRRNSKDQGGGPLAQTSLRRPAHDDNKATQLADSLGGDKVPKDMKAVDTEAAPVRLAYIIDSLVTGGAERLVLTFAKAVRKRSDIQLTVLVLSDQKTPFLEELLATGTEVVCLPGKSLIDLGRFRRVIGELRARSIDFAHAHLISSTVVGGFASAILGIPFATTIHNVKASTSRVSRVRRFLYRRALRLPGVTRIAVGQAVADAVTPDTGGQACIVVPNAVSAEVAVPANQRAAKRQMIRDELGIGDRLMALAVGTIIPQKAFGDMIAAFARAAAEQPQAVLVIAGKAPDQQALADLKSRAKALGIEDRVMFLGMRSDVPALLAAADVFLSSSHWEGAPVSLLEAMINGLPCVMTDVGDNARILARTGAVLPPPGRPDLLGDALSEILADAELRRRCGTAAKARVEACYSVEAWVERLMQIYLLQPNSKGGAHQADLTLP